MNALVNPLATSFLQWITEDLEIQWQSGSTAMKK